jgi:ABC-2 type transport system permease protein
VLKLQLLTLLKYQVKLVFRNKAALIATLALPLLLTYFFTQAGGTSKYTLYVSDADKSSYSAELIAMLQEQDNLLIVNTSESNINAKLSAQKINIALKIEKGFSHQLTDDTTPKMQIIKMYNTAESSICEQKITSRYNVLANIVASTQSVSNVYAQGGGNQKTIQVAMENSVFQALKSQSKITTKTVSLKEATQAKSIDNTSRSLLGFIVLFLWIVVIQGCRTLIDEKENKTYTRMLTTPLNYLKFITAKFISVYLYGLAHIVIILTASKLLFKVECFDNIVPIFAVIALYLFAIISITFLFTLRAGNQQIFSSIGMPFVILTGMLGGTMFPLEIAPKFMQVLAKFTPQGWVMPALTSIYAANAASQIITAAAIFITLGISLMAVFFLITDQSILAT